LRQGNEEESIFENRIPLVKGRSTADFNKYEKQRFDEEESGNDLQYHSEFNN
jgi:hypothetical protein